MVTETLDRPAWRPRKKRRTQNGADLSSKQLTTKQWLFVQAAASGLDHALAAKEAGYTGGDLALIGFRLSRKPHIASEITRARASVLATKAWSLDWWRSELAHVYACVRDSDPPSALRALELAGRHLGALDPQAPVSPQTAQLLDMLRSGNQVTLTQSVTVSPPALPES